MSSTNFSTISQSFLQHPSLPFADVLSEETINRVANECGVPTTPPPTNANGGDAGNGIIYTTAVTLWTFLSQVLHHDEHRSCTAAVARVVTLCIALSRTPPSPDTGAYCRARARWPLMLVQRLTYHVADEAERLVPEVWLWRKRHVKLIDGTMVSTPDTPELQAASLAELSPRQLSFTTALQQIAESWRTTLFMTEAQRRATIRERHRAMTAKIVGNRPGRTEPRKVKRRPKPHPLLTRPRNEERAELLAGVAE